MNIPYSLLADLVAISHILMMIFALGCAITNIICKLRSKFIWTCLFLWIVGVPTANCIFGSCPVTLLEKHLRVLGQEEAYQGHFLEHYFHIDSSTVGLLAFVVDFLLCLAILMPIGRSVLKKSQEA